jgi:hypothetical protein
VKLFQDLRGKSRAELKLLWEELDRAPKTPQARLAELALSPAERLARLHEEGVRRRFREWMCTSATVHELMEVHSLIIKDELDEETWLRDHPPASRDAGPPPEGACNGINRDSDL